MIANVLFLFLFVADGITSCLADVIAIMADPIHQMKPCQVDWQKLVFPVKIDSVQEKLSFLIYLLYFLYFI